jgi:hypothetical protein
MEVSGKVYLPTLVRKEEGMGQRNEISLRTCTGMGKTKYDVR